MLTMTGWLDTKNKFERYRMTFICVSQTNRYDLVTLFATKINESVQLKSCLTVLFLTMESIKVIAFVESLH